jgi:hypothetical protein
MKNISSILLALVAATAACASSTRMVTNPLGEADPVLSAKLEPRSDTVREAKALWISAATCEQWPIEDVVQVKVTSGEICVKTLRSEAVPAAQPLPQQGLAGESVALTADGAPRSVALAPSGAPTPRSACHRPDGTAMEVWQVERIGCVPNDGLVTEATQSLSVNPGSPDEIRWIFGEMGADRFR